MGQTIDAWGPDRSRELAELVVARGEIEDRDASDVDLDDEEERE